MQTRFLRAQLGYDDGHFPGIARDVRNSGFYVHAGVVSHSSPSELSSHQMAPPGVIAHSSPSELSSHQMAPPGVVRHSSPSELSSYQMAHAGMVAQLGIVRHPDTAGHMVSTTAAGPSIAAFSFCTTFPWRCNHYGFGAVAELRACACPLPRQLNG